MTQGLSFGPAADLYDRIRPTYPPAALEWALGREPCRVVDLGAGTGILTRVVQGLGHDVVPVEPDEAMRVRLAQSTPGVTPLAGSAEEIPLPDGAADAVVAGQAYHWFEPEPAHREIARVLKPGGVFAPIWNIRDEKEPWVAALSRIANGAEGAGGGVHEGELEHDFGPEFGPVERAHFAHEVPMTADGLVRLIASRSYYITAPPERQAKIQADVRQLAASLPETFALPYVTVVYRSQRRY
jgi:SAM-dependent methyltransferase